MWRAFSLGVPQRMILAFRNSAITCGHSRPSCYNVFLALMIDVIFAYFEADKDVLGPQRKQGGDLEPTDRITMRYVIPERCQHV